MVCNSLDRIVCAAAKAVDKIYLPPAQVYVPCAAAKAVDKKAVTQFVLAFACAAAKAVDKDDYAPGSRGL